MSAIRDRAVIEAKRTVVQVIAQLLRTLLEGIATLDRKIAEAAEAHPDFFIFQAGILCCGRKQRCTIPTKNESPSATNSCKSNLLV
jgi:hypothetical protein